MTGQKYSTPKALLVKILQWFYLLLALVVVAVPFWLSQQPFFSNLGFPVQIVYGAAIAVCLYCLLLFGSFLTQNTNLLILALVFIFFTTIGGLVLLAIAFPNAKEVFGSGLPSCINNLSACNFKDGIIVASAAGLSVALPLLLLNLITIVGAVKAIAATD